MNNLKLHIKRENSQVSINFCDQNGNTILFNIFYKFFENDIFLEINQIVKLTKYLNNNRVDVHVSGEGCNEIYDEICYYLDNSKLYINYIINQVELEKKHVKKIKKDIF